MESQIPINNTIAKGIVIEVQSIPFQKAPSLGKDNIKHNSSGGATIKKTFHPSKPWGKNQTQRLLWQFSKHYEHGTEAGGCNSHSSIVDIVKDFVTLLALSYIHKLLSYFKEELQEKTIIPEAILGDIFSDRKMGSVEDLDIFESNYDTLTSDQLELFKMYAARIYKPLLKKENAMQISQRLPQDHCHYTSKGNPDEEMCIFNKHLSDTSENPTEDYDKVCDNDTDNEIYENDTSSNITEILTDETLPASLNSYAQTNTTCALENIDKSNKISDLSKKCKNYDKMKFVQYTDKHKKTDVDKDSYLNLYRKILPKPTSPDEVSQIHLKVFNSSEVTNPAIIKFSPNENNLKRKKDSGKSLKTESLNCRNQNIALMQREENNKDMKTCPYCPDGVKYKKEPLFHHLYDCHCLSTITIQCSAENCPAEFHIRNHAFEFWKHLKGEHNRPCNYGKVIWKCKVCEYNVVTPKNIHLHIGRLQIMEHYMDNHLPNRKCCRCQMAFFIPDVLKLHNGNHKGETVSYDKDSTHVCDICGFSCNESCVFMDHILTMHPTSAEGRRQSLRLYRKLANSDMKGTRKEKPTHQILRSCLEPEFSLNKDTPSEDKSLPVVSADYVLLEKMCPFCGKICKNVWEREEHLESYHGVTSVIVPCPSEEYCTKKFSINQLLQLANHMKDYHQLSPEIYQQLPCLIHCSQCHKTDSQIKFKDSVMKASAAKVMLHYEEKHFPEIWCQKCGLGFYKAKMYMEHCKMHEYNTHGEIMVDYVNGGTVIGEKCSKCSFRSKESQIMYDHLLKFHPKLLRLVEYDDGHLRCQKKYYCITDDGQMKDVSSPSAIVEHSKKNMKENGSGIIKLYKCLYCEDILPSATLMTSHIEALHPGEPKRFCYDCNVYVKNDEKSRWIEHVKTHNDITYAYVPCVIPICNIKFPSVQLMTSHISDGHKDVPNDLQEEYCKTIVVKCEICDCTIEITETVNYHDISTTKAYRDHMFNSHNIGLLCEVCGELLATRAGMYQHQKMCCYPDKDRKCSECGKMFLKKQYLAAHVASVHSTTKDHICTVCDKAFASKAYLNMHSKIHSGKKVHSCEYCGTGFTRLGRLKTHTKKCKEAPESIKAKVATGSRNKAKKKTKDTNSAIGDSETKIPSFLQYTYVNKPADQGLNVTLIEQPQQQQILPYYGQQVEHTLEIPNLLYTETALALSENEQAATNVLALLQQPPQPGSVELQYAQL